MWNGYHKGLASRKSYLEQHLQTLWKTKPKKAVSPLTMHSPANPPPSPSFLPGSWLLASGICPYFFPGHKCPMVRLAHLPKPSQLSFRKIKLLTTILMSVVLLLSVIIGWKQCSFGEYQNFTSNMTTGILFCQFLNTD